MKNSTENTGKLLIITCFLTMLSGMGCALFCYYAFESEFLHLPSVDSHSDEYLWLFSESSMIPAVLGGISGVLLTTLVLALLLSMYRGISFAEGLFRIAIVLLPLGLGSLTLLQFNTFLLEFNRFFLVIFRNLNGTWYLFIGTAIILGLVQVFGGGIVLDKVRFLCQKGVSSTGFRRVLFTLVFVISFLIYFIVQQYLPGLNGDEPHYLLIVQSLLRDGDLDVNNNYVDRDYHEYIPGILDRHVTIGIDGTRYSTHPVGLAYMLALPYYLGGYGGCLIFMNLCSAALSLFLFMILFHQTKRSIISFVLWFLVSFSPPILPYSSKIFPELPAAMIMALFFVVLLKKNFSWIPLGFLSSGLAMLPWLQQRFIFIAIIGAGYISYKSWSTDKFKAALPGLFVGLSLALLGLFYFILYGDPLPSAPYSSVRMSGIWSSEIFWKQGLLGLFFDQEFGIMLYSPVFLCIFAGFYVLIREDMKLFGILLFMVASVYIPSAGFTLKWFGSWSPMGRYLVVLIPLFVFVLAGIFSRPQGPYVKWTIGLFAWITVSFTATLISNYDLWTGAETGQSKLLGILSSIVHLPDYFPSFTHSSDQSFILFSIWSVPIFFFNYLLIRNYPGRSMNVNSLYHTGDRNLVILPDRGRPLTIFSSATSRIFIQWWSTIILISLWITFMVHYCAPSDNVAENRPKISSSMERGTGYYQANIPRNRNSTLFPDFTFETKRKASITAPSYVISGPYITLPAGIYRATFTIKLLQTEKPGEFAQLEVCSFRGHLKLGLKKVSTDEFGGETLQKSFDIYFTLEKPTPNIETRVFTAATNPFILERITIQSDENLTRLWRGKIFKGYGLLKKAVREFSQVGPRSLFEAEGYKEGAHLLVTQGECEKALQLLEKLVVTFPSEREIRTAYGEALIRCGKKEEGIEVLQKLL